MSWATLLEEKSALAAALDLVGNKWTFMILTGCIAGYRRFNQIESHLGINRNLLKTNLDKLVNAGILEKQPIKENSKHYQYIPTDMGMQLRPVIVALGAWGEEYLTKEDSPITYTHKNCGGILNVNIYCQGCEQQVETLGVQLRLNKGAGELATKVVRVSDHNGL